MKPNPSLDELLSSFMDGELSPRQRTEVQRLAAHDPQVARRLRQLQNCRSLFSALPAAKAPADLLEQVRATLERQSLLQEQPVRGRHWVGACQLAFRRLVSAAAAIVLLGILGVVIYQIVSPVPPGEAGPVATDRAPSLIGSDPTFVAPIMVADDGFAGRLELQTARLTWADTFIARAAENSGLSIRAEPEIRESQRLYRVVGSRESVNRLVASLAGVWRSFDAAALHVDWPEGSASPVVVEAVTPEQAYAIVAQNTTEASLEAAAGYAVTNHLAKNMPGREIRPLIQQDPGSLLAAISIPKPKETGPDTSVPTTVSTEGKAEVNLTIVLRN
jgi:hypothetical protein